MQEWTNSPRTSTYQPARNIVTYSILCFSLAGLIFGFATGGFLGRSPSTPKTLPQTTHLIPRSTPSPVITATPTPEDILLDNPIVTHISTSEKADGTTSYTFSAQIVYKGTKTPITVTDVTCRLWLTPDNTAEDTALSTSKYAALHNTANLNQPLPLESVGAMIFTAPSAQVQPCAANGNTTWTYTLSTALPAGTYYIYALSDWKGRHFPWYASQIQVTAPAPPA
jgi:hypothetical protein